MSTPHTERIAFIEKQISIHEVYIDDCKADRTKLMNSFMSASTYAVGQEYLKQLKTNEAAIRSANRKIETLKKELNLLQNTSGLP